MEAARRGMDEISFAVSRRPCRPWRCSCRSRSSPTRPACSFREFGITVATSVAISGFVALTLSPMLCARVLRHSTAEHGIKAVLARGFDALATGYERVLRAMSAALPADRRGDPLGGGGRGAPTGRRARVHPHGRPRRAAHLLARPRGQHHRVHRPLPAAVESIVLKYPEVDRAFSVVALGIGTPGLVNEAGIFANMTPWEERTRSQMEIVDELRGALGNIGGIQAFPSNLPALSNDAGIAPISLVLQGPDVTRLSRYADEIIRRARAIPGLVNLQSDLLLNKPQIEVRIDRDRASDLGVSVREIARTLQILFGGLELTTFKQAGETYDVIAQLSRPERSNPRDLYGVYVRGAATRSSRWRRWCR
jgi:multidrug efflux pump